MSKEGRKVFMHPSRLNLEDILIVDGSIKDLKKVCSNIKRDFICDEQDDYAHLKRLLEKGNYRFILARNKTNKDIVGYIFMLIDKEESTLWLDFLAIDRRFRCNGLGSYFLKTVIEKEKNNYKGMFIEVEIPSSPDPKRKMKQEKRIRFYERIGAKRLDLNYYLPTKKSVLPMYLFYASFDNNEIMPAECIRNTVKSAFNYLEYLPTSNPLTIDAVNICLEQIKDQYIEYLARVI